MSKEEKVMACANGIADQFVKGFCDHRMVEFFADVIRNYIPEEPEPVSDGQLEVWYSQHTWAMDKQEYMWGFRDAEKAHGIRGADDGND